jgi:hypothetical protein
MLKRLAILATLTLAFMALSASISSAKLPIGTEDSCASVFTADALACGGGDHGNDSGCYNPPVTPFGYEGYPYWAVWNCWNPYHGWHYHVRY